MTFSNVYRDKVTDTLANTMFDVLVIGGGITGAGIALDATARGMKTAVIEMQDFAAGSSRSSMELLDEEGPTAYQKKVKRLVEAGKESKIILKNSPHITHQMKVLSPIYEMTSASKWSTKMGLTMYDRILGAKKQDKHQILSTKATIKKLPYIQTKHLLGAGYYTAYKSDDTRLTIEVLKKAVEMGATALNYLKAIQFLYDKQGTVIGVEVEDQITGEMYSIYASHIVNATGSWLDQVSALDQPNQTTSPQLQRSIYFVFNQSDFPLSESVCIETENGQHLIAIPEQEKVVVRIMDTTFQGDQRDFTVDETKIKQGIETITHAFPALSLTDTNIISYWVRIQLLIPDKKKKRHPSQRDVFLAPSGLISACVSQLTSYRTVAEKVVDEIAKRLKNEKGILYSASETRSIPVSGAELGGFTEYTDFKKNQLAQAHPPISAEIKARYIDCYGKNVLKIWQHYDQLEQEAKVYQIDRLLFAELVYALEEECIYLPLDFFMRRTSSIVTNPEIINLNSKGILKYLEEKLHWNADETAYYKRELLLAFG